MGETARRKETKWAVRLTAAHMPSAFRDTAARAAWKNTIAGPKPKNGKYAYIHYMPGYPSGEHRQAIFHYTIENFQTASIPDDGYVYDPGASFLISGQ